MRYEFRVGYLNDNTDLVVMVRNLDSCTTVGYLRSSLTYNPNEESIVTGQLSKANWVNESQTNDIYCLVRALNDKLSGVIYNDSADRDKDIVELCQAFGF